MYKLDFYRNKIRIQGDISSLESSKLRNFKPNGTLESATIDKDFDSFEYLVHSHKCQGNDEKLKTWYKKERQLRKDAYEIQKNNYQVNCDCLNPELKEYQRQAVAFFDKLDNCIIGYSMGLGKVNPVDTPVLTKDGWKEIGKLKLGESIYNSQGTLSNVIGIFPQGTIDNYEVTFTDGSKTYCGKEHLWNVQTPNMRNWNHNNFKTMSLGEIMEEGVRTKVWHKRDNRYYYNNKWFIPMVQPIQWEEKEHLIHPYNLGLLLGDGSMCYGSVHLHNTDIEIQDRFIKLADYKYSSRTRKKVRLRNDPFVYEMKRLNLMNHKAGDKFIPKEYLFDSVDNRIHLLQGLMDTDGTAQKNHCSYCTKSPYLVKDITHLVQSLGGTAVKHEKIVKETMYYNITIRLPHDIIPFTTEYHLNRYQPLTKYEPCRAIKDIKYVGRVEGVCIKTTAPDQLYIVNDFILTHNTLIAINCIKLLKHKIQKKPKVLMVVPNYLKYSMQDEINKWSKLTSIVSDGTKIQKEKVIKEYFDNDIEILIVNYEQIKIKKTKDKKTTKYKKEINMNSKIYNTNWNLIVWDEAHRLKTRDSQNSLGAYYGLKTTKRLMLTGTPITKSPAEIWSLYHILYRENSQSFWEFVKYYCNVYEGFRSLEIGNLIKPKEYKKLLASFLIRKTKEQVAPELPVKVFNTISVKMNSSKQEKIYYQALNEYMNPDESVIESDIERFIRLNQITQNPAILDGDNVSVVSDTVIELLSDIENKRTIIGCIYIKQSELLKQEIQNKYKDRKVYLINSQQKNRYDIIENFKKDETGIIVTTIKCLAEGVNLDCCDYMILSDIEWNCGVNEQFQNRIHRMTSTRTKYYYLITVKNTVNEYKIKKIEQERQMSQNTLGDSDSKIIYTIMKTFKK